MSLERSPSKSRAPSLPLRRTGRSVTSPSLRELHAPTMTEASKEAVSASFISGVCQTTFDQMIR